MPVTNKQTEEILLVVRDRLHHSMLQELMETEAYDKNKSFGTTIERLLAANFALTEIGHFGIEKL